MESNTHTAPCRRTGKLPRFLGAALGVWGALVAGSGCKSMTTRQVLQQERLAAEAEATAASRREAEARVAELDAEEAELRRQAQEITDREDRRARLAEAIERLEAGKPAEAQQVIEELLAEYPRPGSATPGEMGVPTPAAFHDGDESTPSAVTTPAPTKKLEPHERAGILIAYGEALAGNGRTEDAIAAFREARELDPKSKVARMNLGSLLFGQQQFAEALVEWQPVLDDGYPGSELLFQIGMARWEVAKDLDDAMQREAAKGAIRGALVGMADNPAVQHWAALAEFETERFGEALLLFEGLLAKQPSHFEYRVAAAQCCESLGRIDDAINHYELAARLEPPSAAQCAELARLYDLRDLPQMAADWLSRAYGEDPSDSTADSATRLLLGTLWVRSSRFDRAEPWLRSIESTDPEPYSEALAWLSDGLLRKGRNEEALQVLSDLRSARPDDGHAHLSAGDLLRQQEKWEEAIEAYTDARRTSELEPDALAGIAEVYYSTNRLSEAMDKYREASSKAPENARLRLYLDQIRTELEDQRASQGRHPSPGAESKGTTDGR